MSYSFASASSEFTTLCQTQLALLTQGLGSLWSAVYLTEELVENKQGRLIPVAIYPSNLLEQELPAVSLPDNLHSLTVSTRLFSKPLLGGTNLEKIMPDDSQTKQQLILPLIYEQRVLGVLVTRREQEWQHQELEQIEKVAQTLAIARCLDRRYQWYREQLAQQQNLRQVERDRLDDLFHQLRNPLTALRTFSKLLLKRLLPEDRDRSVAQSILRESDRLEELLAQFETEIESETEANQPVISTTSVRLATDTSNPNNFLLPGTSTELEAIDIQTILEPLLISFRAIASEKNVELTINFKEDLPLVMAHAKALREVFSNLIDNALKYTPAGSRVKIYSQEKVTQSQQRFLGIGISDSGYGIPPQDRDKIFERHYRGVQAKGDIPGSGLGLAIARDLVEKMGGVIELISPNQLMKNPNLPGTTMIVWLPITTRI